MESIKAFIKTKKGKALLVAVIAGAAGVTLPPEAIDAIVLLFGLAGV
ncbi:hypothetical protein Q4575_05400 [Psychrosphaera sp. 1_MG-2023]|nr:hypothetical protein [Psychrosphaera sp. 1_MG-2023]MDO6718826.1 hypothetical protein [Psychrosphaera sp. 1_MG-2023]